MAKAILIAGDEKRFAEEVELFQEFLVQRRRMKAVYLIRTAYLESTELAKELEALVASCADEPLLFVYNGHGSRDGWEISRGRHKPGGRLLYQRLLSILFERYPSPLLLLNDTCHAGSMIGEVAGSALSLSPVGVIASSARDKKSYPGLVAAVRQSWEERKVFDPATFRTQIVTASFERFPKPVIVRGRRRDRVVFRRLKSSPEKVRYGTPSRRWGRALDALFFM